MDTLSLDTNQQPLTETDDERQRRVTWEADRIAEARAELDAGLYVDSAEIGAWIASIGTDHELPLPPTRYRAPK
jgi:predicted transcriptional regulator